MIEKSLTIDLSPEAIAATAPRADPVFGKPAINIVGSKLEFAYNFEYGHEDFSQ